MFKKLTTWMLTDKNLALTSIGLIFSLILIYLIYNYLSFKIQKERYNGIRFTTKNITYITMLIGVSSSVTIVICMIVPISVLPPIRIAFEAVLIKISGMIFGPLFGLIVGLITELLVIIMVPSFLHPAYIASAVCFGFLSGLSFSIMKISKNNFHYMFAILNVISIAIFISLFFITRNAETSIKLLKWNISPDVFGYLFTGTGAITLFFIWITYTTLYFLKKYDLLRVLLPILLLTFSAEFLITTLICAWGDAALFHIENNGGYIPMVLARLVVAPIKILFNTIILYITYRVIKPLIKIKSN